MRSIILICLLSLCFPIFSLAAGGKSFSVPFNYYAKDEDLPLILTQFANLQGYTPFFSPAVSGKISGRFENMKGAEFLEAMQAAFGIDWYRQGTTLHFYNVSEKKDLFLTPKAMSANRLHELLSNASLFSPDLKPRVTGEKNMLVVSGPPHYLETITKAAQAFEQSQLSNFVMEVFPLKYAWADDTSLTSLDQQITVPGIASILRTMVLGGGSSMGISSTQSSTTAQSVPGLNGQGLAAQNNTNQAQPAQAQNTAAQGSSMTVNIMADPRVNAVVVNDAAYRMPYYKKVIEDLDKPVELVEIHAAIVDVNTNFNRDLGFTFQGYDQEGNTATGGEISGGAGSFAPFPTIGTVTTGGLGLSTIYTLGSDYFLARVEALQNDGNAKVLGRPSVLTVDNIQASLENTSTYYIQVAGNDAVDLFKVEAGTVLKVTPHIIYNEDGTKAIKLAVNVHDNQNNSSDPTQIVGALPPIRQTKINTQAVVGEGQSLLIGGYYYEQEIDADSGVPFFKDIPVLGHLFKKTSKSSQQMERLILLTPRIIRANELKDNLPSHVDNPSFHRSPTQNHYEARIPPIEANSGCSKKATPSTSTVSTNE